MESADSRLMCLLEAILDDDAAGARSALVAGAPLNARDHQYPAMWKLFSYKPSGAFALLEAVNLSSRRPQSRRRMGVIEALLEFGADPDMADDTGFTPVHQAAVFRNPEALAIFIARGADIDVQSLKGYTPLHTAIYGQADPCVLALLSAGARLDIPNADGLNAMQYAKLLGREDMMALLESHLAMKAISRAMGSIGSLPAWTAPKAPLEPQESTPCSSLMGQDAWVCAPRPGLSL